MQIMLCYDRFPIMSEYQTCGKKCPSVIAHPLFIATAVICTRHVSIAWEHSFSSTDGLIQVGKSAHVSQSCVAFNGCAESVSSSSICIRYKIFSFSSAITLTCFIICFYFFRTFYIGSGRWSAHPLWPDAHARVAH